MDLLQEIRNDFAGIEEGRIISITSLGKNDDVIITKSKEEGYVIGIKEKSEYDRLFRYGAILSVSK